MLAFDLTLATRGLKPTLRHPRVLAYVWPILCHINKPVFYRVVLAILQMKTVIVIIADKMLPKPPLPDTLFAFLAFGV